MYYIMNSGKLIDLENVSEKDICIRDIAHHLTKTCRYGGALPLNVHYSVANHSIALLYYAIEQGCDEQTQRRALMHDASEAYLGDVVIGLKRLLPEYKKLETYIDDLIEDKYTLFPDRTTRDLVKEFDHRIVLDEVKVFFPQHYDKFDAQLNGRKPLGVSVYKDGSLELIKKMFLHSCEMLGIRDDY